MFKKFLLESLETVKESAVAPYVGQFLNPIGKETGVGYQVTFVNDKIVKVKGPKGEKTFTRKDFENEFSLAGEAANESLLREESEYEDFASKLREIADQLENEKWVDGLNQIADELEGVWSDEDIDGAEWQEEDEVKEELEDEEESMKESKRRGRPSKKNK